MFVPRGVLHQRDTTGKSVKYQIIKIHNIPVEQRTPPLPPKPGETPKPAEIKRTMLGQVAPPALVNWEILFRRITLP